MIWIHFIDQSVVSHVINLRKKEKKVTGFVSPSPKLISSLHRIFFFFFYYKLIHDLQKVPFFTCSVDILTPSPALRLAFITTVVDFFTTSHCTGNGFVHCRSWLIYSLQILIYSLQLAAPEVDLFIAPEADLFTVPEVDLFTAPEADLFIAPEVDLFTAPEVELFTALQCSRSYFIHCTSLHLKSMYPLRLTDTRWFLHWASLSRSVFSALHCTTSGFIPCTSVDLFPAPPLIYS